MGLPTSQPAPGTHKPMAKLNELFKPSKVCSLEKATDPYQAIMAYRATTLESGLRPAELLMGKKTLHKDPYPAKTMLDPSWSYPEQFGEKDAKVRKKENFDKRHFAKTLPDIPPGERVWLPDQKVEGTVLDRVGTPRSYTVETPSGEL